MKRNFDERNESAGRGRGRSAMSPGDAWSSRRESGSNTMGECKLLGFLRRCWWLGAAKVLVKLVTCRSTGTTGGSWSAGHVHSLGWEHVTPYQPSPSSLPAALEASCSAWAGWEFLHSRWSLGTVPWGGRAEGGVICRGFARCLQAAPQLVSPAQLQRSPARKKWVAAGMWSGDK